MLNCKTSGNTWDDDRKLYQRWQSRRAQDVYKSRRIEDPKVLWQGKKRNVHRIMQVNQLLELLGEFPRHQRYCKFRAKFGESSIRITISSWFPVIVALLLQQLQIQWDAATFNEFCLLRAHTWLGNADTAAANNVLIYEHIGKQRIVSWVESSQKLDSCGEFTYGVHALLLVPVMQSFSNVRGVSIYDPIQ